MARMGDHFRVKHGFAFKGEYFESDGPFVLLTPGSFNEEGGFRDQGEKTKYYTGDVPGGFVLDEGDLIVAMTEQAPGLLGSSAWIPVGGRFLHNQRLGRIVELDEQRLDGRFLYFLFNTKDVRHQVSATATGGKVRHTAPDRIGQVTFRRPPIDTQRRIADTLAAYDDLIENNRRRMALLEEAARQLYREWFVRLRFPGHEHTRIIDGVPKGWERVPLGDRVVLNYGKALKSERRAEGPHPVYGSSGIVGKHEIALVPAPGIVVGRKGNVGSVFWCSKDYWPIDTVYFVDAQSSNLWLYYALAHLHFISTDVAVPGLNREFAYSRLLLVPPHRIVRECLHAVAPMHQQITWLDEMNEKLRSARNLLLPRLMSGEITV
jgi:type I restriction enzyme S subunit